MIEVEVHQRLRAFLRDQGEPYWPHHLTMGRFVARALRLERSVLLQTGVPCFGYHGRYRLSYLLPALVWPGSVVVVASEVVQQRLLMVELPQLQEWVQSPKPIRAGDRWPGTDFQGILMTTPEVWLADRLTTGERFPRRIPTILDGVDDLEQWAFNQLTTCLLPGDWNDLVLAFPTCLDVIRDARVQLTKAIFHHPANPYECYLLDETEKDLLHGLYSQLCPPDRKSSSLLPPNWNRFYQQLQSENALPWATIVRSQGQFSLCCGPVEVASALAQIWPQQPVVLIGSALDAESDAPIYRQRVGLEDITCLKFVPDRQTEQIQLYLPDGLPMPNTSLFQSALMREIRILLSVSIAVQGITVLLVGDMPLKAQVGSQLAAEFGSRVQVEKTCLDDNGILVTGWEFWRQHQAVLPSPRLLIIATLPIPSLENPLVAGRVAYFKRLRQDWFRLYLLPAALSELQRAVAPVRDCQGVVALLDNRVIHRSYGAQVLTALSPLARINYVDASLFSQSDCSVVD
ncbi:helicase [Leptolyngbya sp. 'hensonii']|uniref:helicase C-terminal domain-containing protein n=1 Tax=Leptolyngbya sp. 'hensonii' TaxID=1922337 RepID=UPI00094FAEC4|nr:helicase C-terminal domain-containing protein [Leptolyngbya sp. 'hensonii']OLP17718.1 helicase [Leptolyngbya sp. 'hensonii']